MLANDCTAMKVVENLPTRRINIDGGEGRLMPLVPYMPVLSSASQPWEGFLVERHVSAGFEVPRHNHSSILLSMQLNASLPLEWKSESGGRRQSHTAWARLPRLHMEWSVRPRAFRARSGTPRAPHRGEIRGAKIEVAERWNFRDARLEHLLKVLYDELRQGAPTGRLFSEQVGNAVAMLLANQYSIVTPGVYGTGGRIPTSRLKRVFDYVEAYLDSEIHLSNLARTASMSPYYFARLFKHSMGISPHQYIAQRRIKRAKHPLRTSQLSVFEIGVRVGYTDPKHFRTLFRREVGFSPSEFRATHFD
jgi:AraC family transcriptional regulator